ncbi:MFS transporter [Propioniciclava soli]|uniref:Glycoside-pentoside-hexuronide (GPH):cation symporter n=1 Tax=Propioniciclava soli TaxID=2775081 RepID=A0ABZ3C7Q2_9ACTN|nr:glycoside-pentoside-hexuronide (GPH):cation symporter [Propioniciclava soli]
MKKIRSTTDSLGVEKSVRPGNYLADAFAQVAMNSITGLVGLLVFVYTDKVGMAAGTAGLAIFLAKIVDAFTDLVMGPLVDRTNTRWGKARPWFLWMALPAAVVVPLLFTVPSGASDGTQLAWALGTNILATGVVATALGIPYAVLMVYATKSSQERGSRGLFRAIAGFLAGAVLSIFAVPLSNMLGGDQAAWQKLGIAFGVIAGLASLIVFLGTRERNEVAAESSTEAAPPVREGLLFLLRNPYWVKLLIFGLLANMVWGLGGASGVYWAKWVMGDENIVALLGTVGLLPYVVGFAAIGPLNKRFGLTNVLRWSLVLTVVSFVIRSLAPANLTVVLVGGALGGLGGIAMMVNTIVLVSLIAEWNELKFGHNLAGLNASASNFGGKIGAGVGAAMIGWILAATAYDPSLPAQETPAYLGILAFSMWIPGLLALIQWLLLWRFDLEKIYPGVIAELEERRAAARADAAAVAAE